MKPTSLSLAACMAMILLSPVPAPAYVNVLVTDDVIKPSQTYENQRYGFEVRYPVSFKALDQVDSAGNGIVVFTPSASLKGTVRILCNGVGRPSDPPQVPLETAMVDEIEAVHEAESYPNGGVDSIFFEKDKVWFEIRAEWGDISDAEVEELPDYSEDQQAIAEALDMILVNFKFTKPAGSSAA